MVPSLAAVNKAICAPAGALRLLFIVWVIIPACKDTTAPEESPARYSDVRPRWSPDGATIVFRGTVGGKRGVAVIDTAGMHLRLLHEGEGIGFAWSPGGRWICFSAYGSLYRIGLDGDSLQRLTTGVSDMRPAWSPDGDVIVFVRTGLWILRLSTGSVQQLIREGDYPSWHASGREVVSLVAYGAVDPYDPQDRYSFEAVDVQTGMARHIWSLRSSAWVAFATTSPVGDAIVFSTLTVGGIAQVWKVSVSDSTVVRLTDDGGDFPSWSPDGTALVYTRVAAGDGGLWQMRADGSGKRRLTGP